MKIDLIKHYDAGNRTIPDDCSQKVIQLQFKHACKYGRLDIAKWLYETKPVDITKNTLNTGFYCCCHWGFLEIAKWIYNIGEINTRTINDAFQSCCMYGYFDIVQWLYAISNGGINIHAKNDGAFRESYTRNIEIAKWLYQIGNGTQVNDSTIGYLFLYACQCDSLESVKWIHEIAQQKNLEINHETYDKAYCESAEYGHISILQWIHDICPDVDIENAFKSSCENYELEDTTVLEYLYNISNGKINLKELMAEGYIRNFEIYKWFYEKLNGDIDQNISDEMFDIVCEYNSSEEARWFCSKFPTYYITINTTNNEIIEHYIQTEQNDQQMLDKQRAQIEYKQIPKTKRKDKSKRKIILDQFDDVDEDIGI